jgi:hypothetical protein
MLLAVPPHGELEAFRERVDDADADAVQAPGHFVGIVLGGVLELPAGMQLGHDYLGRRHALALVDAGRDAAAIVLDRDRAVGVEDNADEVAMAGQRLVDRIVRHLEYHMVEARAVVGVADIHSGPLADRVEALQHLDRLGAVAAFIGGGCHLPDIATEGAEPKDFSRIRPLFSQMQHRQGPGDVRMRTGERPRTGNGAQSPLPSVGKIRQGLGDAGPPVRL